MNRARKKGLSTYVAKGSRSTLLLHAEGRTSKWVPIIHLGITSISISNTDVLHIANVVHALVPQ